jgi:mono/diheme cytochrome c family protein
MTRLAFSAALILSAALLVAPGQAAPAKSKAAREQAARAAKGLAFATAHCAACHGVTANSSSPNPESPTFEDIANQPGLTRTSLRRFLTDSHNYPEAMQFTVERAEIRNLADYMLTLRRPGYKPAI